MNGTVALGFPFRFPEVWDGKNNATIAIFLAGLESQDGQVWQTIQLQKCPTIFRSNCWSDSLTVSSIKFNQEADKQG